MMESYWNINVAFLESIFCGPPMIMGDIYIVYIYLSIYKRVFSPFSLPPRIPGQKIVFWRYDTCSFNWKSDGLSNRYVCILYYWA